MNPSPALLTTLSTLAAPALAQAALQGGPGAHLATAGPNPSSAQRTTACSLELLITNVPGYPESQVSGLPGYVYTPTTTNGVFDRLYGSANGNWVLAAIATDGTSAIAVLVVNGTLALQFDQPAPWTGGTENCGDFEPQYEVNDAGDLALYNNTDGSASSDEYVVARVGGAWSVVAQEGGAIAALPGSNYRSTLRNSILLADGRVGFEAFGVHPAGHLLILDDTLLMQQAVTVPTGQASGTPQTIEGFDNRGFWAAEDGTSWLVRGDLNGPGDSDDVVIVDGVVVLQEDTVVPGSGYTEPIAVGGVLASYMDPAGNWFARGSNAVTGHDWVVRNGAVIAERGDPVVPGSSERFDDSSTTGTFFLQIGNSQGDYVIGGATDDPNPQRDTVLVLNGSTLLCRESDPIDMDGNGAFDDDTFIDRFRNDQAVLTDDGRLIFTAFVRGTGFLGQAVLMLVPGDSIGQNYCTANPNSSGLTGTMSAGGSATVADNSVLLIASDLSPNSFGFFITSRTQGFVANPAGSEGNLCVLGNIGRYVGPGQIQNSAASGKFGLPIDLTQMPQPNGSVAVAPGETWYFQAWHRDTNAIGPTSNFTDGLSVPFQ